MFINFLFTPIDFSHDHVNMSPVFNVADGNNTDNEHGIFFTIRAKRYVDINPSIYSFFVNEKGHPSKQLNFSFRSYVDIGEEVLIPVGGDRSKQYRYDVKEESDTAEADNNYWSDGEYLGFDMPMTSMGIDIVEGKVYGVMIKDPNNEIIFIGEFEYQEQD